MNVTITSSIKEPKSIAKVSTPHANAIILANRMPYLPGLRYSHYQTGNFSDPKIEVEITAKTKKFIVVREECQNVKNVSIPEGQPSPGYVTNVANDGTLNFINFDEAKPGAVYTVLVEKETTKDNLSQAFANLSVVHIPDKAL